MKEKQLSFDDASSQENIAEAIGDKLVKCYILSDFLGIDDNAVQILAGQWLRYAGLQASEGEEWCILDDLKRKSKEWHERKRND